MVTLLGASHNVTFDTIFYITTSNQFVMFNGAFAQRSSTEPGVCLP
jgi:hypothetical protein